MSTTITNEFSDANYEAAINWLFAQIPNYQRDGQLAYKPGLENISKLCEHFGNPQNDLKCIHIGGTNGKGSTSSMLASILQEAGYTVGLYNSPHLIHFTERIKINGKECDRQFAYDMIIKLQQLPKEIEPSFFEFTTIMAFVYFKIHKVDFAIIEVGLGGRLDATNIIKPLVAAITNVALDHQNILGNTLEEITNEKAGIIKSGIPIICGDQQRIVQNIIKLKCSELNATYVDATVIDADYPSDLQGNYQVKNKKVVVAIIDELIKKDILIPENAIIKGFLNVQYNTKFIGRWTILNNNPLTVCDTAHNQAGLLEVFKQLDSYQQKKHIILGFVSDKNIDDLVSILPKNATYYFAKPNVKRGRDPKDYQKIMDDAQISYKIFDSIQKAYLFAKQECRKDEMIFVGGSNFVVGEFLEKNLETSK